MIRASLFRMEMNRKVTWAINGRLWLLVGWLLGIITVGCRSTDKPASARFASVELQGNTPGQISLVIEEVFRENGYQVTRPAPDKLLCEKKDSAWNNLVYGSWVYNTPVWLRVKVSIVPVAEARFRLECHAYEVQDRGAHMEDELAISTLRSHPYQKLLNEVAKRLTTSHIPNSAPEIPSPPK